MEEFFEKHADTRMLIKDHLKKTGTPVAWLASRLNYSRSFFGRVLNQERTLSPDDLIRINEILETTFEMNTIESPKH